MRMINHLTRTVGPADGVTVTLRYFTLVCELREMKGARLPHISLTVAGDGAQPETWSVEADGELVAQIDACDETGEWEPLLDHLAERYDGHPLGELARSAADRLAVLV